MSTPIETNTEELQEILQTVYNLPNRSGGSTTPDLVLSLNLEGKYLLADNVIQDAFSIKSGSVQTTYTKLKNREEVTVFVEYIFCYGNETYTGVFFPILVGATDYKSGSVTTNYVHLKLLADYVPGYNGSLDQISLELNLDGTIHSLHFENLHA